MSIFGLIMVASLFGNRPPLLCNGGDANESHLKTRLVGWLIIGAVLWLIAAGLAPANSFAADRVALVEYSKGAVSAVAPDGSPRLIGRGSELYAGELVETASQSFAILKFEDGTLMTLRPDTEFRVENFVPNKGRGQAMFRLLKGGFRVLTGFISKSSDGVFRVDTPVATIGVRGTEFDARLCRDRTCSDASANRVAPAAVLVATHGQVRVEDGAGIVDAAPGDAVALGARIDTAANSNAVIQLADGSRMTLTSNSALLVPGEGATDRISLLAGGLRAAFEPNTANPTNLSYSIKTKSADVKVSAAIIDLNVEENFAIRVWDGCVDVASATASVPVCAGQSAIQQTPDGEPLLVSTSAQALRNLSAPDPTGSEYETKQQTAARFDLDAMRLYVTVNEGRVDLSNNGDQIVVGPSQNAVALPEGEIELIEDLPDSMRYDAMPKPGLINDRALGLIDFVQGGLSRSAREANTGRRGSNESTEVNAADAGSEADNSDSSVAELAPLECAVQ